MMCREEGDTQKWWWEGDKCRQLHSDDCSVMNEERGMEVSCTSSSQLHSSVTPRSSYWISSPCTANWTQNPPPCYDSDERSFLAFSNPHYTVASWTAWMKYADHLKIGGVVAGPIQCVLFMSNWYSKKQTVHDGWVYGSSWLGHEVVQICGQVLYCIFLWRHFL